MDVPDRLPYEVLDRLFGDTGPQLSREHHIHHSILVVTSKKSGTIRPFVRVHPRDLVIYQALVDALAPTIELMLSPSDRVGAYRQTLQDSDDAFAGSPRNDEFKAGLSTAITDAGDAYVLTSDISGYFLGITPHRLASELVEVADSPEIVFDLEDILRVWQERGVRGLPQGIRPSSPLANVYLASLDQRLGELRIPFYRWVDDMWAICSSFSEARGVQDEIERHLYRIGLTLNGEKTRIVRGATAIERLAPAKARFEEKRDQAVEDATVTVTFGDYVEEESLPDPDEVDIELAHSECDRLVSAASEEDLPKEFHGDVAEVLRRLEAVKDDYAFESIPILLRRAPDLTSAAMRYVTAVGSDAPEAAVSVFAEVLRPERFMRDHEKLAICHMSLSLTRQHETALAERLGSMALRDHHPLVRARALVAWGLHSDDDDFGIVDEFLGSARPQWRVYALVAMQGKSAQARDQRYERWARGTALRRIAEEVRQRPIRWSKL